MESEIRSSILHSRQKSTESDKPALELLEEHKQLYPEQRIEPMDDDQISAFREVRFKDQHAIKTPLKSKEFSTNSCVKRADSTPTKIEQPILKQTTDYDFFYKLLENKLNEKLDSRDICRCIWDPQDIKLKHFKRMDENESLYYMDYVHFTRYFVESIFKCAMEIVEKHIESKDKRRKSVCTCEVIEEEKRDTWCTIEEFDIDRGHSDIFNFLSKKLICEDAWLLAVEFIGDKSDGPSDLYFYEAVYSMPSKMYPIPQATVSIFFTIEVSRIIPKSCPVNVNNVFVTDSVTCAFEGSMMISEPDELNFSENQLLKLATMKIDFFKSIRY